MKTMSKIYFTNTTVRMYLFSSSVVNHHVPYHDEVYGENITWHKPGSAKHRLDVVAHILPYNI